MKRGEDPDALDKDVVRRHYVKLGYKGDGDAPPIPDDVRVGAAQKYIEAYESITGEAFVPNTEPPLARMAKNLKVGGAR
jgi:phosphoribosylaminoimidazole-succinocarboxamide synthase